MNSVKEYRENLDNALDKIKNNSEYLGTYEHVYVMEKIKKYLDDVIVEFEKVDDLLKEID